jgi:SAM-dependent methyltransferase
MVESTKTGSGDADRSGSGAVASRGLKTHPFFRRVMFLLRYLTQLREWYIIRELGALLRDPGAKSFFDAGCGYGEYSYYAASRFPGIKVTSLEYDRGLAADFKEFARRIGLGNVSVIAGDVLGLDDRGAYDVVLCGSVLEHIEEDEKAISNLVRALRPGGRMLVYVPTAPRRYLPHYRRMEARADERAGGSQYGHVRDYGRDEIVGKLKAAGLGIEKTITTYGVFGAIAFEILYTFLPHSTRFSRRHWLILPPYFLIVHPFVLLLMCADLLWNNKRGNGFMGVAVRPDTEGQGRIGGPGQDAAICNND